MSDVTIVTTGSEQLPPNDVEVPATQGEVLEAETAQAEAAENISSDAVEIARINADRDVTIAAVHAETEQVAIEARSDHKEEVEAWREEVTSLREQVTNLSATVAELAASLTPPASALIEATTGETLSMTPNAISDPTSETVMEAIAESEGESPAADSEPARRRRRRI